MLYISIFFERNFSSRQLPTFLCPISSSASRPRTHMIPSIDEGPQNSTIPSTHSPFTYLPLTTRSTNPSYPYCIPLSSIVDDSTYSHWECGDVQTSYEILPTPTDDFFFTETETETETETDDPFTEILTDFPVRTVTVTADVSSGIVRTVTVTRGEESTTTSESEVSSDLSSTIGTGTTAADVTPTFEQGPARSSNAAAGKGVGVVVGVVGVLGAFGWI
ncbi:hypothetical protein CC78DRAFT_354751 [Lojkania enalia]|uniref:Uncharacterized protein n=1 Tax=Lojkania enalia TaxID=147567 RepID=A0A9P4KHC7_9PLEO|nr:hypothetical protein CC78DRAFT_354751 [Didymosphaeria enalia]